MKCPHCLQAFHEQWSNFNAGSDPDGPLQIRYTTCAACSKMIVYIFRGPFRASMVHPKGISRTPLSNDVPADYADDYKESCLVLPDSPKASAALSRRCLQNLLRGEAKVPALR